MTQVLSHGAIPGRGNSVNPFVVLDGAVAFIRFAESVFGGREVVEAHTTTPDGRIIHGEMEIGDALILLSDTQPGWSTRPGLFQVWVADVADAMEHAIEHGSTVITDPTPFYGSITLARIEDPWGNLWWLYQPVPGQADPTPVWEGGSDTVFRTIDEYMRGSRR
ncbi:hypothetical protein GCM10027169_24600 [Gordonia jinhuaensis]|uniref:VOC domain-containing protein n=1 Tax=Gordonia jinhuaensis TaxID=1517702 RepID=A0A916WYB5_9ACTN|nr:VOC family protein [Gordonia jinhuaensis]GGB39958.1 hypothetical protein GCM10011489_29480 [Gordonia jinhuaensis]